MNGMRPANSAPLQFSSPPAKGAERLALAFVLSLHVVATFILLPPQEILRTDPLRYADHPVHTHRVYMYRQALVESGFSWGYDPAVSAGVVTDPSDHAGAMPQQVLGVLLPFVAPGTVVRLFLFLAVLMFPLWTLLACRRLGIPVGAQVWVMLTLIVPGWLYGNLAAYFRWGLASFATASYFLPYVLALFLAFLARPGLKIYLAFCFAGGLLFLLHILGPVVLVPSLVLHTLAARPLSWPWRIAILLAPLGILALNAFWFLPFLAALGAPQPAWPPIKELGWSADMTYENWRDLFEALTPPRVVAALSGLGFAVYGLTVLRKFLGFPVVVSLGLAAAFALFLKFFGSFLPVFKQMQPARFLLPAFALLTFPVGVALFTLAEKVRLRTNLLPAGLALLVVGIVPFIGNSESEHPFLMKPTPLPLPPSPDPLADFVASRTIPADRLLIQSIAYELKVLPLVFGREIIGNTFPSIYDPAQFHRNVLWGKELDQWSPSELRPTLNRWGVNWVFTVTEKARSLFAKVSGTAGDPVGEYHAFRISASSTRFLMGKGRVVAKVNRLELSELDPEDGFIVLRYRYHPAWQTASGLPVHRYPVPEDPSGFIALRDPGKAVTLYFKPWEMLHAPWPR